MTLAAILALAEKATPDGAMERDIDLNIAFASACSPEVVAALVRCAQHLAAEHSVPRGNVDNGCQVCRDQRALTAALEQS